MSLTIAVVSDLHCHPSSEVWGSYLHTDAPRIPVKKHPVSALLALLSKQKLKADILLMPGDLADRCNKQGFASAWPFVKEIATALQVEFVGATLGNHDVDSRKKSSGDPFAFCRTAHTDFPFSDPLLNQSFWSNGFCIHESNTHQILIINSVKHHHDEIEAKKGLIIGEQLEMIEKSLREMRSKGKPLLALVHHHPIQHEDFDSSSEDLMSGGSDLIRLLETYDCELLVHGHKHHAKLSYSSTGANSLAVFASGSLSATNAQGLATNTRNLFHYITLEPFRPDGCTVCGTIRSWEFNMTRGWNTPNFQSAGFPAMAGFGCRLTADELAKRISDHYNGLNLDFIKWNILTLAIPQLRYILPSDFDKLGIILESQYRLRCLPKPPDEPDLIGRII
jgi:hypothetical protein